MTETEVTLEQIETNRAALSDGLDWIALTEAKIYRYPGQGLKSGLKSTFAPTMEILEILHKVSVSGGEEPFVIFRSSMVWSLVGQRWNVQAFGEWTGVKQ